MTEVPVRMQIACYNLLVAEILVRTLQEADKIWSAYAVNKYRRNQPMGCAAIQRADLPRVWNVPVGSVIYAGGVN